MPKRKPATPPKRARRPAPDVLKGVAERLEKAMAEEELNATQLAEKAEVSKQFVTRALRGERRDGMQAGMVVKVAQALRVRVGWLLAGEPPMRSVPVVADNREAAEIVRATLATLGYETGSVELAGDESGRASEG